MIPLTSACGIFQWLTDTLTLKAFLETDADYRSSLTKLVKSVNYSFQKSNLVSYFSSVKSYIQKTFPAPDVKYFLNADQEKLMINYSKISDRVYRYGLSGALKTLSQSPEAFFYLRNRLAASHGVQCSALWILGIGDRHLSNFLVSTKHGKLCNRLKLFLISHVKADVSV